METLKVVVFDADNMPRYEMTVTLEPGVSLKGLPNTLQEESEKMIAAGRYPNEVVSYDIEGTFQTEHVGDFIYNGSRLERGA